MLVRLLCGCALGIGAAAALAQPLPPNRSAALANPASVNCEKLGGKVAIHDGPRGQFGICVFKDGRECDEWALYRDDRCVQLDAHGWPIAQHGRKPESK
ncbi:DUF333 domain-containing protein [Burkholderia mayonis]|uniref:Hemolysin n=1 Tax=Burkholderia mayonis TaxID=1385591 RepID=A0A1B4G4G8_9BURK|nr:DUF333 domain-containing protein [Burkholderia mayonis]AOJ10815.1 hypothetical protein WS71_27080 [Burkholderia mayonis]KVE57946.1 hypothetical protein WS71_25360 [Burkholderia mayonis]